MEAGQPLALIHGRDDDAIASAAAMIGRAVTLGDGGAAVGALVQARIAG